MRITRYRDIDMAGYVNPATRAHKLHSDLAGGSYAISRAQAYRETIEKLFAPYASPGGYPVLATVDATCLCADCAKKVYLDERVDVNLDIYWEGPTEYCDACNTEIESAYGDPDDTE